MKKFSRLHNTLIGLFLTIISIILIVRFFGYIDDEFFYRKQFDLDQTEVIQDFGATNIRKIEHNFLEIEKSESIDITAGQHYQIQVDNKEYIFAADKVKETENSFQLSNLVWFFSHPIANSAKSNLKSVKLHRKEISNAKSIHLLVDDLGCCLTNGKKMRYIWNKKNREITFLGKNKDIYGYAFTGFRKVKIEDFLSINSYDFTSDYTLIWLGRNDTNSSPKEVARQLKDLANKLLDEQPNTKLYILTPAPSPDKNLNEKINKIVFQINQDLKDYPIIDVNSILTNQKNWKEDLFYSDYALNEKAYYLITTTIDDAIF